jgi:esterase
MLSTPFYSHAWYNQRIEKRPYKLRWLAHIVALHALWGSAAHAQPEDRFVDLDGLSIHYLDWGTANRQPLIMLHGIGRIAHTFDHVAPHFVDDYHVLAVDMRGHGDSGWDSGGNYLVIDYVRDVKGLVERLGLENIVLWGNSTGGRVAQVLAGLYPGLVSALIVEDVGPERPPSIADRLAARIRREEAGWASEDELLAELSRASPRTRPEVLRAYARYGSRLRSSDQRVVFKRDPAINNGFVPTDLWRFVREIEAPTIFILGGASPIVPAETQQALRETLPQVRIETMPGLGHYPSEEDPDAFLDIVDEFLDGR